MERLHSGLGILFFIGFSFLISKNRKAVKAKPIIWGVILQLFLGFLFIRAPGSTIIFSQLNKLVVVLQEATNAGTSFVFGYLGGGPLPFEESHAGASYILAFQSLPLVLIMYALTSLLFHLGILQRVVQVFSYLLKRLMGLSGCESLGAAANVFMGMVEAPMFIRPYLKTLTKSELFSVMVVGMATVAGTMMVLYADILRGVIPDSLAHIIIASIISAPAALGVAKIIIPETESPREKGFLDIKIETTSCIDAISQGALEGLKLFFNIVALLIVFVGFICLINKFLGIFPLPLYSPITFEGILGWIMAPFAFCMGIPWKEAVTAGSLLGTKIVLNELLAYLQLGHLEPGLLSERSKLIMTYALCGFANFGSLGIMIGGIGGMAPERRGEIVQLGIISIIAGVISTMMTGCVVGMIGKF